MKGSKKKLQKSRVYGIETKKHLTQLIFGAYGLRACESGRITPKQIETFRRGLSRYLKKNSAQVWFRHTPISSVSQKPIEIRMGKGKGALFTHVIRLRAGSIFCEIDGILEKQALVLLRLVAAKLSVRCSVLAVRRYM